MSYVQSAASSAAQTTGVAGASLTGVIAKHGLVCFVVYEVAASSQTLTDSSGTTWGLSTALNVGTCSLAIFETTSAVGAGTHTVTASFSGGSGAWTFLIEETSGSYLGKTASQKLVAPGAGNTLVPGATMGVAGSAVYQIALDGSHAGPTFQTGAGAFNTQLFGRNDATAGASWSIYYSGNVGGTNPGMAPGSGDSTGADTYGIAAVAFAPGGMSPYVSIQPQFSEEPTVYFRSPDYAGLLFNRITPAPLSGPIFALLTPRPQWTFFESPFVSVYPVVEAFSNQATQPAQIIVSQLFKPSRRLEALELVPEQDDYRRWNHGVYWQYVRLYAAQLVGYTFTVPDLCDDPWLEWVHPKKSDESAIYPYRQINVFIRGQQFNLFWNQPKPWPVTEEIDTVSRLANYGVMQPWARPAIAVLMPNVVGLPVAVAAATIENIANLPPPDVTYQNNVLYQLPQTALIGKLPAPPPVPAGIVIGQSPPAGAILNPPFFTLLIVSTGLVSLPGQGASTNYSPVNVVIGDDTPP